jgi:hypothetical protein
MQDPKVHPNDVDPERALVSERKRLALVEGAVNRMQREVEELVARKTELVHRALVIDAEVKRLEALVKKQERKG